MPKKIEFQGKSKQFTILERDILSKNMIDSAYKKREAAIEKSKTQLADELYDYFMGPYEHLIEQLPERFTREAERGEFNTYAGSWHDRIESSYSRPRIAIARNDCVPRIGPEDGKLYIKFQKLQQKIATTEETKKQDLAKTKGALSIIRTTRQLFEQWPEAYAVYLARFPAVQPFMPPAIQCDELNKNTELAMSTYTWKFVQARKTSGVIFWPCQGNNAGTEIKDVALAYHFEQDQIAAGHTFKNSIDDFLKDSKASAEARLAGKSYEYKIERMTVAEFNKFLKG